MVMSFVQDSRFKATAVNVPTSPATVADAPQVPHATLEAAVVNLPASSATIGAVSWVPHATLETGAAPLRVTADPLPLPSECITKSEESNIIYL